MTGTLSLQALVFDVGGVIVRHDNDFLFRQLAEHCADPEAVDRIRAESSDSRYNSGALTIDSLHAKLVRELDFSLSWDDFRAAWCCHLGFDDDMLALVRRLAVSNRVILFSNTNPIHWDYLEKLSDGVLSQFETYLSYEIGLTKPAVDAFRLFAKSAGIEPSRSLFIDDLAENVEGARRAGFQAELFLDKPRLETLLTKFADPGAG